MIPKQNRPRRIKPSLVIEGVVGVVGVALIALVIGWLNANTYTSVDLGSDAQTDGDALMAASVLGVVVDHNLKVLDVEADSAAEKAGIQRGDILIRHDGQQIASAQQVVNTLRAAKPGQQQAMLVRRGGQEVTLTLKLEPHRGHPNAATPTAVPHDQQYL